MEDDSSDSDLQRPTKLTKLKKPAVKQTQKKQKDKSKETNAHNKKSSEVKAKKAEKKPSAEKKVAKKKSKDILEEESAKVLDIVEKNKPLGEDNLSLISDNLAWSVYIDFSYGFNNFQFVFTALTMTPIVSKTPSRMFKAMFATLL